VPRVGTGVGASIVLAVGPTGAEFFWQPTATLRIANKTRIIVKFFMGHRLFGFWVLSLSPSSMSKATLMPSRKKRILRKKGLSGGKSRRTGGA